MSNSSQKAIVVLCGAAAATALYLVSSSLSKKSTNPGKDDKDPAAQEEGGNKATVKLEKTETLAETAPTTTKTTTTSEVEVQSVVSSVAVTVDAVETKASVDVVAVPVVEKKDDPIKAMTSIVATSPSIQTLETLAAEEESVGGDENKQPVETKSSTAINDKTISSLNDAKSLETNKTDDDAVQATTTEVDNASGDDSDGNPAVDVSAILKARKNAAKNGKGKSKNTAASAAIKELKSSQQQQGKNKKKKAKNWQ